VRAIRPVIVGTVLALAIGVASVLAIARQEGLRLYVVHTGSMMPTLNPGDVVVDEPARTLKAGEIVTFRHSNVTADVVTHRIRSVRGGVLQTKGDANRTADLWHIPTGWVRGVVVHRIPHLGYALVFLKQPAGIGAVMTFGLAAILLWGLFFPGGGEGGPSAPETHAAATDRPRRARLSAV